MTDLTADLAAAASAIRDRLHAAVEREVKAAIAEGWSGKIWAWVTMHDLRCFIHVSRAEPDWPIEDLFGDVTAYEIPRRDEHGR